uniref:TIR domain-containing protein n=1 Tax=Xenopus tropicalis TaxID=8364 RepID=A0A803J3Y6_XENTR
MCATNYLYDFSLWYCLDDAHVAAKILCMLEQNCYRGYDEHRDKTAGTQAIAWTTNVIQSSRISFLIVSATSLNDPWFNNVSEWSLVNYVDQEAVKVVPIYVGIDEAQRPHKLRFLTSLNYDSSYFPNRLLASMKPRNRH